MSATEQMRAMLDQLMGTERAGDDGKRSSFHFTDNRICKSFLLDCCPHEILASTRMDLGDCTKIHELALRADYQKAAKEKKYFYELDALDHLTIFVADADNRTELAKKRLAETQEELSTDAAEKLNRVHELAEQIGKCLAAAETAGNEGNVEESLKMMEEVEKIKKEKMAAEADYRNSIPTSSYQQQKLRVCEVCSAYLGIQDNDRRLADHFGGKLHLGFIAIREKLDEMKALVAERRAQGLYENRSKQRDDNDGVGGNGNGYSRGGGDSRGRGGDRRDRDYDRRDYDRGEHRRRQRSRSRSVSPRDRRDRRGQDRGYDRGDRGDRRDRRDNRGGDRDRGHRDRDNSYYRNGTSDNRY